MAPKEQVTTKKKKKKKNDIEIKKASIKRKYDASTSIQQKKNSGEGSTVHKSPKQPHLQPIPPDLLPYACEPSCCKGEVLQFL